VANSITFKVKVEKDGNLKVVAKEADAAAKSTDNLGKSTDSLNRTRDKTHKREKSLHQSGLSGAKAFSKQAQTINGGSSSLVGAYAVLAANIFALTAAFGALQRAAQVQQLEAGLEAMGRASGTALKTISNDLREATGHALNLEDAMRATALATSAGFDSSSIQRLGDVARKASIALGRDTADSLNRLTKGAIKLEPELLDELGIMVRLDEATEKYATALGKNANQLTTFERRQAFMNAVLEEGEKKFAAMGDVDTNPFDRLSATFNDLTKTLLNMFNNVLIPLVGVFANSQAAMLGAMILFGKTIATSMIPGLSNLGQKYAEAKHAAAAHSLEQLKSLKNIEGGGAKLKKLAKAYDPAIHGQDGLNQMMRTAQNSYAVNERQLDALIAKEGEHTDAVRNKRATLQASGDAIDVLTQYQDDFNASSTEEIKTNALASAASGNYKDALSSLGDAKVRMTAESKVSAAGLGFWGRTAAWTGLQAGKLALNIKVLGTAFLTAIPIIGQIIAVLGIVWSLIKKVYEMMKSDAQKKFEEDSERVASANEELAGTFEDVANRGTDAEGTITSLSQEYVAMDNALSTMAKNLENTEAKTGAWHAVMAMFNSDLRPFRNSLETLLESGQATTEQMVKIAEEAGANKGIINQIKRTGSLNNVNEELAKTISDKLIPELQKVPAVGANLVKTFESSKDAVDKFVSKNKLKSGVDDILTSFTDLDNAMAMLDKDGNALEGALSPKAFLEVFKKDASQGLKDIIDYEGLVKEAGGKEGKLVELIKAKTKARKDDLKTIQTSEKFSKQKVKTAKSELAVLKLTQYEADNYKNVLAQQKIIGDEKVQNMQNEVDQFKIANAAQLEDQDIKDHILRLEKEIANEKALQTHQQNDTLEKEKETLAILQFKMQATRAIADGAQKILDLTNRQLDAEETVAMNAARSANRKDVSRGYQGELSKAQEFAIRFQDKDEDDPEKRTNYDKRKDAIAEEFRIKKLIAAAEWKILTQRMRVLQEEMRSKKEGFEGSKADDNLSTLITNLEASESQVLATIDAERIAAISNIEAAREEALEALRQEVKNPSGSTTQEKIKNRNEAQTIIDKELEEGTDANTETGSTGTKSQADTPLSEKVKSLQAITGPLMEDLKKLGPEGELVAAVSGGAMAITGAWAGVAETFDSGAGAMEKGAAVASAIGATISQVSQIMAASSKAKIAGIDKEIAAEKKRDGKSKESLAKIKQLEKKKEAEKKKAFERQKKMQMAQIVINTAAAIMEAAPNWPMMIALAVMGAAQLAIASGASYQGAGGSSSSVSQPSAISVGKRRTGVDLSKSKGASGELDYFRGAQGVGGPENFRGAFYGKRHRAMGGNAGYVVGEQGPELFMPDRPGTIVPADDTAAMANAAGNVTFNINTVDATGVEDLLIEQQGNIIGMLRNAANSYGEEFMEDVDETTYTSPVARRA